MVERVYGSTAEHLSCLQKVTSSNILLQHQHVNLKGARSCLSTRDPGKLADRVDDSALNRQSDDVTQNHKAS